MRLVVRIPRSSDRQFPTRERSCRFHEQGSTLAVEVPKVYCLDLNVLGIFLQDWPVGFLAVCGQLLSIWFLFSPMKPIGTAFGFGGNFDSCASIPISVQCIPNSSSTGLAPHRGDSAYLPRRTSPKLVLGSGKTSAGTEQRIEPPTRKSSFICPCVSIVNTSPW